MTKAWPVAKPTSKDISEGFVEKMQNCIIECFESPV